MQHPAPRPLPPGGLALAARSLSPTALIAAVALSCFAAFYGTALAILGAPAILVAGFIAPGLLGATLAAAWVAGLLRRLAVLRRGAWCLGTVTAVEGAGATVESELVLLRYTFQPQAGTHSVAGTTRLRATPAVRAARPGDPIAVVFLPAAPQRSLALALAG